MAVLEKVIEMQTRGIPEQDIIKQLRDGGASPQEINDAINQAKVKQAVSPQDNLQQAQNPSAQAPQEMPQPPQQEMQQSIMQQQPQTQAPLTQEIPQQQPQAPQEMPQPPQQEQPYYSEQPQAYSGQEYYPEQQYQSIIDTDTITEIAEQVVSEKFQEFEKKTGDLATFKNQTQDKLQDLDDRLKRIEASIDKLQQAVIGKIGEFGESTAAIHKDLDALHSTTSKLMNPLIKYYSIIFIILEF